MCVCECVNHTNVLEVLATVLHDYVYLYTCTTHREKMRVQALQDKIDRERG